MAKPIRTTTILTGKAAEAFEEYMQNAKPSEAKREMVAKARKVRDAIKRRDYLPVRADARRGRHGCRPLLFLSSCGDPAMPLTGCGQFLLHRR